MSLLIGLTSKCSDKLGGICGPAGFLPFSDKLREFRKSLALPATVGDVPIFFMRGNRDILMPMRYYRSCTEKLIELGVKDDVVEAHEYGGLGRTVSGQVIHDMCSWLEKVISPLE